MKNSQNLLLLNRMSSYTCLSVPMYDHNDKYYINRHQELLPLVNELKTKIQATKVKEKIVSKCKRSTLMSFFS